MLGGQNLGGEPSDRSGNNCPAPSTYTSQPPVVLPLPTSPATAGSSVSTAAILTDFFNHPFLCIGQFER